MIKQTTFVGNIAFVFNEKFPIRRSLEFSCERSGCEGEIRGTSISPLSTLVVTVTELRRWRPRSVQTYWKGKWLWLPEAALESATKSPSNSVNMELPLPSWVEGSKFSTLPSPLSDLLEFRYSSFTLTSSVFSHCISAWAYLFIALWLLGELTWLFSVHFPIIVLHMEGECENLFINICICGFVAVSEWLIFLHRSSLAGIMIKFFCLVGLLCYGKKNYTSHESWSSLLLSHIPLLI